jgi:hypothetical protein
MTEHVITSASSNPAAARFIPGCLLTPFGWAAQPLTAMIAAEPTLLPHIFQLDRPRMHVIALALAHLESEAVPEIGPVLLRRSVRQVLDRVLGRPVLGLRRVLNRLPFAVLQAENYRRLVGLLDDAESSKLLRHHADTELNDSTIEVLYQIPKQLRSAVIAVVGFVPDLDRLADGLRLLVSRGAAPSFDALVADLAARRQPDQFVARVKQLVGALPLPEALPPRQIGKARRLDCVQEIRALATAWRNCLAHYAWQVDKGDCAIYLWDDPPSPAACHVTREGRLGWVLNKPLGPKNSELEPGQIDLIWRTFADAGVPQCRAVCGLERILQSDCDHRMRPSRRPAAARAEA